MKYSSVLKISLWDKFIVRYVSRVANHHELEKVRLIEEEGTNERMKEAR